MAPNDMESWLTTDEKIYQTGSSQIKDYRRISKLEYMTKETIQTKRESLYLFIFNEMNRIRYGTTSRGLMYM